MSTNKPIQNLTMNRSLCITGRDQETVYDSAVRAAVYPYWMGELVSVFATPATYITQHSTASAAGNGKHSRQLMEWNGME